MLVEKNETFNLCDFDFPPASESASSTMSDFSPPLEIESGIFLISLGLDYW